MSNSESNQPVHPEPATTVSNAADQPLPGLSAQQLGFARDLGLEQQQQETDIEFVKRIEQHLGQESMLELARWFLLSILQHLKDASWNSISESQLETAKQYELAAEYIARDEFKQSLLVVLKDHRLRFTLLGFAKARDPQRRILSSTTKAFRRGREILLQHGLVNPQPAKTRKGQKQGNEDTKPFDSTMSRRAARRVGGIKAAGQNTLIKGSSRAEADAGDMSEEEFTQLDKALGEGKGESGQSFTYHSNEERLSLLLGALAGGGLFLLSLWIFF
jgi:hypothetical protein